MKKRLLIGLMLLMISNGIIVSSTNAPKSPVLATWIWDAASLQSDPQGLLTFLQEKNITIVHVQIDQSLSPAMYGDFIEAAGISGIQVFALDGAPVWAAPNGHEELSRLTGWLVRFQQEQSPARQFSGIHLDVEPYLYTGWQNQRADTIEIYQGLLLQAQQVAQSLQITMELDLPFWFDEISYDNRYGKGNLAEWAITHSDRITVMAYRNSGAAIAELVKSEMEYASTNEKSIIVGIETMQSDEGDYVSFYGKNEAFMNKQLQVVHSFYASYESYGGVAIHHLDSWRKMKP